MRPRAPVPTSAASLLGAGAGVVDAGAACPGLPAASGPDGAPAVAFDCGEAGAAEPAGDWPPVDAGPAADAGFPGADGPAPPGGVAAGGTIGVVLSAGVA